MLKTSNRIVASSCSECGERSKSKISIFDFSGNKCVGLCCNDKLCRAPIGEIRAAKDKYRISINCPACGELHTYTLTKHSFWGKEYICLNCPTWEVAILHFGNDEKFIDRQTELWEDNINEMLGQAAELDDNLSLMYELIECINFLAKTDNVKCGCDNPEIAMELNSDSVVLFCKSCARKKIVFATEENIDYLMKTGTIVLDNTILNFKEDK